jgi:hypothetical protein
VLPVEVLDLLGGHSIENGVDINLLATLVVPLQVEEEADSSETHGGRGGEVETVANVVVGSVKGEERPEMSAKSSQKHSVPKLDQVYVEKKGAGAKVEVGLIGNVPLPITPSLASPIPSFSTQPSQILTK